MNRMADLVLEGRLLGCIMVHPDTWAEVAADFQPDMFSDLEYREVAQIMVDLTSNNKSYQLYLFTGRWKSVVWL